MQHKFFKSLNAMASRDANIWLTVAAILFVVLMAWLWNSRLAGMVSGAAGLQFNKPSVWITDANDKQMKADFISSAVGTTIKIGFRSTGVQACTPSWQQVPANTRYLAPVNYQVTGDVILTVTCTDRKGVKVASDGLQITTGTSEVYGFPVTKPAAGDVWELGKTYQIVWKAKASCAPSDLGCDANPIDPQPVQCTGSGNNTLCVNPSASSDVVNCIKAPCPGNPSSTASTVTISLNAKSPDCLNQIPACAIKQSAPYIISQTAPNSGTFSWTVPQDLQNGFRGEQQITITNNTTGAQGRSAVFMVGKNQGSSRSLTVVSPNGGEQWVVGDTKTITWTDSSQTGNVKITLVEQRDCTQACTARADRQYTLTNATPNNGTFAWKVGTAVGTNVAIGQYRLAITNASGATDESNAAFTISDGKTVGESGIEGQVTIGPSCPGPISQNDTKCADKPYKATFTIKTANGSQTVKSFSSDANGAFRVSLDPGTYLITSSTGSKYPTFNPQTVVVTAGKYTRIDLSFDSGIR